MAKADIRVLPLKTSWNGVTDKGELPSRLKVLNWGVNDTIYGPVIVNDHTAAVFEKNQRASGRDTVQVDFNHNTLEGSAAYQAEKEPRHVAGYGNPRVVKGEGIFLEAVETTATGATSARDFKDLSPVPLVAEDGTVLAMHSVALCQTGAADGLTLESAGLKALSASVMASLETDYDKSTPDAYKLAAETTHKGLMDDHLDYFTKQLNLSAGATAKDVFAALRAVWEGMKGKAGQGPITPDNENQVKGWDQFLSARGLSADGIKTMLEGAVKPLVAKIDSLEAANLETRKVSESSQRAAIIQEASKAGKAIPLTAPEIEQLPLALLRSMVAQIQPSVPLKGKIKPLKMKLLKDKKGQSESSASGSAPSDDLPF